MRAVWILGLGLTLLLWTTTSSAVAQAPQSLLPPSHVERPVYMQPWVAVFVPLAATLGGVAVSASIPNNEVGFWLAGATLWLAPSVGNIALGNYAAAGAAWAIRTLGVLAMLPGVMTFRGHWSSGPKAVGQTIAYFVLGVACLAGGLVLDLVGGHSYAKKLKQGEIQFGLAPAPTQSPGLAVTIKF